MNLSEKSNHLISRLEVQGRVLTPEEQNKIALSAFLRVSCASIGRPHPLMARWIARALSPGFNRRLEKFGIPVNMNGFEGIDMSNIPLFVGNHQPLGEEAMTAYNMLPLNTRILLKDELTTQPFFGAGIRALDPIIVHREEDESISSSEFKRISAEIKATLERDEQMLIFPEGTRSRDGGLLPIQAALLNTALSAIKKMDESRHQVGVITTNSFPAASFLMDKSHILGKNTSSESRQTPININFDVLEVSPQEKGRDFAERVRQTLESNLHKMLDAQLAA